MTPSSTGRPAAPSWHTVSYHYHASLGTSIITEVENSRGRRGYRSRGGRIFLFDSPESERLAWLSCQIKAPEPMPRTVYCELDPFAICGRLSETRIEVAGSEAFAPALWRVCAAEHAAKLRQADFALAV